MALEELALWALFDGQWLVAAICPLRVCSNLSWN